MTKTMQAVAVCLGQVDPEAGVIDGGGLVLLIIGFLLGVLSVKAGLL